MLASEVPWTQLNPARGDQSPRAGTLWGDRNGTVATGFLFSPVDGFESPPHIHNVSYRGVVIRGEVHNDHPVAPEMWMPARSYWTQPKGEVHITAARGSNILAYIEIDQGPYLVMPPEEQFSPGEHAINVHESNLVWVAPGSRSAPDGVEIAHLWEDRGTGGNRGMLVRVPAGVPAAIEGTRTPLRIVVIQGEPLYLHAAGADVSGEPVLLSPGSFASSTGGVLHQFDPGPQEDLVLYVRTADSLKLTGGAQRTD
ncbi:MAG: DUF4437 domain-containing protein [Planctomycetota bacterium]